MNPGELANADQTVALAGEMLPSLFHSIFEGLKERGFSEQQAMVILIAYVHGTSGGRFQ